MYNNFERLTMYNLNYKKLLVVEPDFSSFVLHTEFLLFLSSWIAECVRFRSGFDVESSFFSKYDLRATLSFVFPSLLTVSRLVVNRNISFAWLIVYLGRNVSDVKHDAALQKDASSLWPTFCTTMLIMLPDWTLEVWVPRFPARIIITHLRLASQPTPSACHPRLAADRLFKRFSILHAH